MKKPALLLSLLLLLAACEKKNQDASESRGEPGAASVPEKPPVAGDLVLTAELAEIPGAFPANDLYNYAYVMKYKVVQVLQGTYGDPEILVGHYNPRFARNEIKDEQDAKVGGDLKSFQVGDKHYLVLSPLDGLWTGAVEDDYFKEKRTRYWSLWADKSK
jgi:hypothetical protein